MQIRPLHDRVIVKRVEGKEVMKGALSSRTAKEKPMEGKSGGGL
jgi:co-chaperonin GroES (HSP10)